VIIAVACTVYAAVSLITPLDSASATGLGRKSDFLVLALQHHAKRPWFEQQHGRAERGRDHRHVYQAR